MIICAQNTLNYWCSAYLGYYPIFRAKQDPPITPWDVFENNKIGSFPWEVFFDETDTHNHDDYDVSPDTNNDGIISLDEAHVFAKNLDTWAMDGYYDPYYPYNEYGAVEYPQSEYESSFTKDFITLNGYMGTSRNSELSTSCNTRYFLSDKITIDNETVLTINNNHIFGNGYSILNYGTIQTSNENNNSYLYDLGIENYGEKFRINNCNFVDGSMVSVVNGIADIRNSTFNNTPLVIGHMSQSQNQKVISTSIIGNNFSNSVDAITINASSNVHIEDNNINAKSKGIYMNNCIGNVFGLGADKDDYAVYIKDNDIHDCDRGILSYCSNTYISNNKIHGNVKGISLYNLSNTVIMGNPRADYPYNTQEIKNNKNLQIETIGNSFPKIIRYNCISNNVSANYLIRSTDNNGESMELDVSYNSWKPIDDNAIVNKLYANYGYHYKYLPTWEPSIQSDTSQIDPNPGRRMLAASDSLIGIRQYSDAYNVLTDIVDYYPNTNEAIIAMKSLLHLRYYTDNDYNSLKNYYRTNSVILANSNLAVLGDKLANKCDEILQNYDDAIEWYENVIEDENASYEDKVFATIDLGNLYLIIGEEGNKSTGTLAHLIPKSAEQHAKTTAYLLSTLHGDIINKNQDDMMKDLVQNCVITTNNDNNVKIYIKEGNAGMAFYNALGVVVKQLTLNEGENTINTEALKAGVYIWKISSDNIVNSGKFIKKNNL